MKIRFLFIFIFLISCEKVSQTQIEVPTALVSCSLALCKAKIGSYPLTVIYTRSGCAADQSGFDVGATGVSTSSCNSSGCSGVVNTWTKNLASVTQITSGQYYVCGWLDFNNNAVQDSGDAIHSTQVNFSSSSSQALTDWSAF